MAQIWRRHAAAVPSTASSGGLRAVALLLAGACAVTCEARVASAQSDPRTRPVSLSTDDRRHLSREDFDQRFDDLSNSYYQQEEQRFDRRLESGMQRMDGLYDRGRVTPEMQKLRPLVAAVAREGSRLVRFLADDAYTNPGLQLLQSDAYRLNARVQVLAKRIEQVPDQRLVDTEFRELDAGWRELAYKLARTRDLGQDTKSSLVAIQDLAKEISTILKISPQVDSRQMVEKLTSMSAELRTLDENLAYELGRGRFEDLQIGIGRARRQLELMTNYVYDQMDQQQLVAEYQRFQQQWSRLAADLQKTNSRTVDRSLRRITQIDNEIHSLLLLPPQSDSQQLVYLTGVLRKDIDEFFQRTPLSLLLSLQNSERALATADQFYGVCEHFIDTVNNPVSGQQVRERDVIDAFRYIEEAQVAFSQAFRGVKSTAALAVLQQIEQTIDTLRQVLQVQSSQFDRNAALDLAADVANQTDELDRVVRRWLTTERPPFGNACIREVESLATNSANLQRKLYSSSSVSDIGRDSELLYDNWRRVYDYIKQCQTEDRRELGRIANRLTPSLFQLRTMLVR